MTSTLLKTEPSALNAPIIHRVPGGPTIVAEQMPVDAVNLSLWLNVGSAIESDAINGMAHFLEHMIFKGTDRLKSGEFERRVEERGAVTNAATSQDYTYYHITTAPKDFSDLAPLQTEVVMNPSIPDEAFERERFVVLEEIRRAEDNPRRRTFQRTSATSFGRLPYRRPVLGPVSVIEQLIPQQMRDFHTTWYDPANVTAVVVGNLPVDRLIQTVEDSFSRVGTRELSSAIVPEPQPLTQPEPGFTEIVRREYDDDSLQQARLVMTWRVPGMVDLTQTYALDVLATVLGHGRTARLVQDLREVKGLVSNISANNMTYQHQGLFSISARLPVENLAVVEAAIVQHLQRLQEELVTPGEIARVRTQVANHFIFSNETPGDRAGLYGYYYALMKNLTPALSYPTRIQAIDAPTLQEAARKYLSPHAYAVVIMKPSQN